MNGLSMEKVELTRPHLLSTAKLNRLSFLLLLLFGISYAYFAQDGRNANVLCRAALAANVVQTGRIDINEYADLTIDKAAHRGNVYCDKAPGMSFLALPTAYIFTRFFTVSSGAASNENDQIWAAFVYLCAHMTSALLVAVAGVLVFRYLLARTDDLGAALVGSIAFGLASPIWGWATSFFSHAAAAALLTIGLMALDYASRQIALDRNSTVAAFTSGVAFGTATAVEYTSLVPALLVGACIAVNSDFDRRTRQLIFTFAVAGLGALLALVPVFAYHAAAFGSPFSTGYQEAVVFEATQSGFFGIGLPDMWHMAELLWGSKRGLLWISPIVLASLWATVVAFRFPKTRAIAASSALVFAWYLCMNAGFSYWLGGYSTGPRYLTPALGIMMLTLGLAWPHFGKWARGVTLALLVVSIGINLAATSVTMAAPDNLSNPLIQQIWPNFFDGYVPRAVIVKFTKTSGLFNLLPLLTIWAILAWAVWREIGRGSEGEVKASTV